MACLRKCSVIVPVFCQYIGEIHHTCNRTLLWLSFSAAIPNKIILKTFCCSFSGQGRLFACIFSCTPLSCSLKWFEVVSLQLEIVLFYLYTIWICHKHIRIDPFLQAFKLTVWSCAFSSSSCCYLQTEGSLV